MDDETREGGKLQVLAIQFEKDEEALVVETFFRVHFHLMRGIFERVIIISSVVADSLSRG